MNLLRKQSPFFPSLVDEFVNRDWNLELPSFSTTVPAVNIIEKETEYKIELAVPGMRKDHFEIEMEEGILSISANQDEEKTSEKGKFTRREFSYNSFRRSFTIPESVDPAKIDANYTEGVLFISLPKRKEALPQPKKLINIR
ncbi:Hsp20/alpha crystallin family protein [Flavobacteriaceae bacterium]|jgi:HSP20 family protein|nr:Hsp20/alpha crystallin family protein [Flavobacteriaceae bacterium]MDB3997647.1 Hsp20/alpha crystallin family protein [Flavobacteriaceae bacterium]MDC1030873.1 Hsp20/alpha crystallin family protein [Flavobacteriaceae bacterium]MDC1056924.1 Hsp20/alpha crystallin family protein [Flavobacteriaceae bacterium]MDC3369128.1 Hsp20/alpha crystallin family protein [Flavobacteriaceae bacterium]